MAPNLGVLDLLGYVLSIGVLVCSIMVIVKMFQRGKTGPGIGGIVGLIACCLPGYVFTLIYGWMKADEWRIKNLMIAYSVVFALSMVLSAMTFPAAYRQAMEQMRQAQLQQGAGAPPAPVAP